MEGGSPFAPSSYRVQQEAYAGPLYKLLELVREHKVDLFKVSLGIIAEEFLAYVKSLEKHDLDEVGDYLVIAGQLLVLKSRSLLPTETEEEEEEPVDEQALLLSRLKDYERFREAAGHLRKAEEERRRLYLRETPPPSVEQKDVVEFYEVNIFDLATAFKRVLEEIGDSRPTIIQGEEYTIDEKMAELQILLHESGEVCLTLYLGGMRSRVEVIVTFLALLELIRLLKVRARQVVSCGDIWIYPTDPLTRNAEGEVELSVVSDDDGFIGETAESDMAKDYEEGSGAHRDPDAASEHSTGEDSE
jgi:segregation and condensation protein A